MEFYGEANGTADVTLEQAIHHKYCPLVDYSAEADDALLPGRSITQTALTYKPGLLQDGDGYIACKRRVWFLVMHRRDSAIH